MTSKGVKAPGEAVRKDSAIITFVYVATAAYLIGGLITYIAWRITGNGAWLEVFFRVPGALLMVAFACMQVIWSLRVSAEFSPGEPLYMTWRLVGASAACEVVSSLAVQIFTPQSRFNPLVQLPVWTKGLHDALVKVGFLTGGSMRFSLMAAGLLYAVRVYRRSGFLGHFTWRDRSLLLISGAYVVREFRDLWIALLHGRKPPWSEVLGWPVDPLLLLLLAEALLLYRSTQRMGTGWVGRSWVAFSVGIAFVVTGDSMNWAKAYGYLKYPWSSVEWYIWLPPSAAFTLAPLYQWDVIQKARAMKSTR